LICPSVICDEISKAQALGKEFIEMLRQHNSDALDQWLGKAKISGLGEFNNFAIL
jgi:hypothetical protein